MVVDIEILFLRGSSQILRSLLSWSSKTRTHGSSDQDSTTWDVGDTVSGGTGFLGLYLSPEGVSQRAVADSTIVHSIAFHTSIGRRVVLASCRPRSPPLRLREHGCFR